MKNLFLLIAFLLSLVYGTYSQPGPAPYDLAYQYSFCEGGPMIDDCVYDLNPIRISTNTTLNNAVFNRAVIIETGVTVEVYGTIKLSRYIIIEKDAKLDLKPGSVLTEISVDQLWDGIFVYGNADGPQNLNSGLHMDNATISKARRAIRVYGPTICGVFPSAEDEPDFVYQDQSHFNGGYVNAVNSRIIDNGIGVLFKEYRHRNYSIFKNCRFFNTKSMIFNDVRCVLIDDKCEIESPTIVPMNIGYNPRSAILANNSDIFFIDNHISTGHQGPIANAIYMTATHPWASGFANLAPRCMNMISENHFFNFDHFIECSGLDNLWVSHNNFENLNAYDYSLYMNGANMYNVKDNIFSGVYDRGIYSRNIGSYGESWIRCNSLTGSGIGIHVEGMNGKLQIPTNDMETDIGILVNGMVEEGNISLPDQLEYEIPAMNCFTKQGGTRLKVENNAGFKYYIPSGTGSQSCLFVGPGAGYQVEETNKPNSDPCDTYPIPPDVISDVELDQKTDTLCMLRDAVDANPGDLNLKKAFHEFSAEFHSLLEPYIQLQLENQNFGRIEQVLSNGCDLESGQKLYGYYMVQEKFNKAQEVLDNMIRINDHREQAFKNIQQIYLDWKKTDIKEPLDQNQVDYLTSVANMDIPERGFARGILMTTMNIRIVDFEKRKELLELRGSDDPNDPVMNSAEFLIKPNPASDKLTLVAPDINFEGQLTIIDLSGRIVLMDRLDLLRNENKLYDISHIKNGIYKVIVTDSSNALRWTNSLVVER